jgi:hypothetical protein
MRAMTGMRQSHERAPRRPVLEIGDRMVGKIRPKHVSQGIRVEYTAEWDQEMQLGGRAGLAASEGPVQPDDHLVMLRMHALTCREDIGVKFSNRRLRSPCALPSTGSRSTRHRSDRVLTRAAARAEALSRLRVSRAPVPRLGDTTVSADATGSPGMTVTYPDRYIKDSQRADHGG